MIATSNDTDVAQLITHMRDYCRAQADISEAPNREWWIASVVFYNDALDELALTDGRPESLLGVLKYLRSLKLDRPNGWKASLLVLIDLLDR